MGNKQSNNIPDTAPARSRGAAPFINNRRAREAARRAREAAARRARLEAARIARFERIAALRAGVEASRFTILELDAQEQAARRARLEAARRARLEAREARLEATRRTQEKADRREQEQAARRKKINERSRRINNTDTLSRRDRTVINCSAVIVGHGLFPNANQDGANLGFVVPEGVNVFFYATPGKILYDSQWRQDYLPENTFASAICRDILEEGRQYSLKFQPGSLAPNLNIITDGYYGTDNTHPRDIFVSGIKVCSKPFTIAFEHLHHLLPMQKIGGRNTYSLGNIVQYCLINRGLLFDGCNQDIINIHVVACMECANGEDSVDMFARRYVQHQHNGEVNENFKNEVVDLLRNQRTTLVDQFSSETRESHSYRIRQSAQEYDDMIMRNQPHAYSDMNRAAEHFYKRVREDTPKDSFITPPRATRRNRLPRTPRSNRQPLGIGAGSLMPMQIYSQEQGTQNTLNEAGSPGRGARQNLSEQTGEQTDEYVTSPPRLRSLSHKIEHLGRPLTEPEMHVDAPSEANIVNDEWMENIVNDEWMENRDREREK